MNEGNEEIKLSVSEFNHVIKTLITDSLYDVTVIGEISTFRPSSTGHWYFDLKDENASLSCVAFKFQTFRFPPIKDGDRVEAFGKVDFWEKGGKLSFNVYSLKKVGLGDLKAEIEKRKAYYSALGYFDLDKKKKLPEEIKKLGIITSPTGAALQDILRITKRRAPNLDIIILPTSVQGESAAGNIAFRIKQANLFSLSDVLIVGRGGGSEEDLAPFSSSEVIEAIYNSAIPVISAVGHEIDFPLSDNVSDIRASTPSAAAELVTEKIWRRKEKLQLARSELTSIISYRINKASSYVPKIETLYHYLERKYKNREFRLLMTLDYLSSSLSLKSEKTRSRINSYIGNARSEIKQKVLKTEKEINKKGESRRASIVLIFEKKKAQLLSLSKEINALSPLSILNRGYSIVLSESGKIIKDAKNVKLDEKINIRLYKGKLKVKVESKK